jgi:D-arabinose 1-dehydrogenase-like Zn-dependent alcohol dehydrogenase
MATKKIAFVDGSGGGLASMAAAIAASMGREAIAATTAKEARVPAEVAAALREIDCAEVKLSAKIPAAAERVEVDGWGKLFEGEGDLERMASARIARDRIEKRVEAMLKR